MNELTNSAVEPFVRLSDVSKRYGSRTVLDGLSLDIAAGRTTALIGPSGGGKSTLLRCINGLQTFDAGTIRVGQEQLAAGRLDRRGARAQHAVRRYVGMVFQDFQLFPHFTALENITEAPRQVLGWTAERSRAKARELLERVGLADRAAAYPHELSGGQKQRVAIARALAMQPKCLLCDEITSALDPELKHEVLDVLEDLRREGMTLVVVTHEMGFARRAADQVVVLAEGRVVEHGPPDEIFERPRTERTARFLRNVLA